MIKEKRLEGFVLKSGPLGENDRLLTLISEEEGITRLAVPGARKPRSSLSAAVPLTLLKLHISARKGLSRVSHIKVIRSFNGLGKELETLAAAQAISELTLMLVPENDPIPGIMSTLLIHIERLEQISEKQTKEIDISLASCIQACVHLLALGGYGLPIQKCCRSGIELQPPIGEWEWKCGFIPSEGFAIGLASNSEVQLNPSELALLQRLIRPTLPIGSNGKLMGPRNVWLKLLNIIDLWVQANLEKKMKAITLLK